MRTLFATSLLALIAFAAGCGGSSNPSSNASGEASKSAKQIVADAVKAADAATSLHMVGKVNASAQQIGFDLSIVTGKGATGSMTIKGAKVDLIVVGAKGYLKGGSDFWTKVGGSSGAMLATVLNGKWLEFPVNNAQFGPLIGVVNAKSIFDQIKTSAGKVTKEGTKTYKGQNVVALNGGSGSSNGTLYVANSGTPYPVALLKTGAGGGSVTFDSWNDSVTLTAPKGALDLSTLGFGG
jgi:hypothetical protein